jgi:4-aminobutyrate aminotransferase
VKRSSDLIAERARWVPRGVATPAIVTVAARGSVIEAADGREYLDFAGGIGCLNLGHGPEDVVAAIHRQVDTYLHQCFMVSSYEPYVAVCRKLAELSPCRGEEQKTLLVNSGSEAVENAIKIARAATGRPAVVCFERGFHGRTLLTMTLTSKLVYKNGFGPYAPEVYRVPAPYPFRGLTTDDALAALAYLFKAHVDPATVACLVLEPVQGEGGFIPMDQHFLDGLRAVCDRHGILYVDDEVQSGTGRTGRVWAVDHFDFEPDLLVSGKSLGGGLPLAAVTGRAEVMDAVAPGGLGGTFGGNPVACAAAAVVLDRVARPEFRERAGEIAATIRSRLDALKEEFAEIGDVRGLGAMLAIEVVCDRGTREPASELTAAIMAEARARGLIVLACGLGANVLRLLPPLTITDEELGEGLERLESAVRASLTT